MRRTTLLSAGLAVISFAACTKVTALAQDLSVDKAPTELTFGSPVTAPSGNFALCLSFEQPAESETAAQFIVALRDVVGRADTLRGAPVRTGKRTMCLHGTTPRAFQGVTLVAPHRMMLRQVDWRAETKAN